MHTSDGGERAGDLSGRFTGQCQCAGVSQLRGLTWRLPSDPSRQAGNPQGFREAYRPAG
ncbi:hypothetical protein [Rahnella sp. AA]|uniref:hypothetical protein n=1 Tax=Rahnella sp. AA TaxID=2057180 RepID=UPI0012FEA458|nr:hypothetical protein [Rahnella sp. AA]